MYSINTAPICRLKASIKYNISNENNPRINDEAV